MAKTGRFSPDFGDGTRFRELVLYVAARCEDDPTFGAVKLNKILFYSDFYAYRSLGAPITGAIYQKLPEGPAPREMVPQRSTLLDTGQATMVARPYFNGVQHRIVASPEYDQESASNVFSVEELKIVEEVIEFFWGKTARETSDYSHRERGWNLVAYTEDIPYETAWLSVDPLEEDELEYGRKVANERRGR